MQNSRIIISIMSKIMRYKALSPFLWVNMYVVYIRTIKALIIPARINPTTYITFDPLIPLIIKMSGKMYNAIFNNISLIIIFMINTLPLFRYFILSLISYIGLF